MPQKINSINLKIIKEMKKVFFALMAAVMMFMVSCGASEAVKDGEAAAKEFSEAYKSAAGNTQAVLT
ncbi:MAG: hypothetical protein IIT56_03255, partial [Bacteroidales bacterium]|nr:hypothetical protein [Bacteroidales bacterium]